MLVVLRFEHERSVTEFVMIIDGELAVSERWLTAVETDFLLFFKDALSVHWEAKARHSNKTCRQRFQSFRVRFG